MLNIVKNNFLGLASDQYAGKSGVKVPFFGKETLSPIGATYFHIKSGVPILIGFCKLKSDYTYSISFEELNTQDLSKNIRESSILVNKKFNSILENEILKQPEQFFWFHRKWR
jgi:KDO2-lipid IV(A) lauroyltransferase